MKAKAALVFHDDWMVNVLLDNGKVYVFQTELWWEHGDGSHWPVVELRAINEAQDLDRRGAEPFCTLPSADVAKDQLIAAITDACMAMSDEGFSRLMRR